MHKQLIVIITEETLLTLNAEETCKENVQNAGVWEGICEFLTQIAQSFRLRMKLLWLDVSLINSTAARNCDKKSPSVVGESFPASCNAVETVEENLENEDYEKGNDQFSFSRNQI